MQIFALRCNQLEIFKLKKCTVQSDSSIKSILSQCKNLKYLSISGCSKITGNVTMVTIKLIYKQIKLLL